MRWPWKSEERSDSYTDNLVAYLLASASGKTIAAPSATGALESCAGLVSRCFSAIEVTAPPHALGALGPGTLGQIGRALIRSGEIVYCLDVQGGELLLLPCESWDVGGASHTSTWTYRLSLGGPDRTMTVDPVPAAGVIHCKYSTDPQTPWRGVGPIQSAALAGRLSAETTKALGDELSGPVGALLPIGADGSDPTITALKGDIGNLKGKVALVERLTDWASGGAAQGSSSEWAPRRIGASPPPGVVQVAERAFLEVIAACGVPPSLFVSQADGTAQRESFRRLLHSTIQPLARIVQEELSAKLNGEVKLSFDSIMASDISGKSRAFTSMVNGGMSVEKAAGLAGLMESE